LQCAIVLAKLERFDWEIARRLQIGERYQMLLADLPVQRLAVRSDRNCVWGQFTLQVDDRPRVQQLLKDAGIPTAIHYPRPLHHQPAYAALCCPDCCPNSVVASTRVMSLPMSADLSDAQQDAVVEALRHALS